MPRVHYVIHDESGVLFDSTAAGDGFPTHSDAVHHAQENIKQMMLPLVGDVRLVTAQTESRHYALADDGEFTPIT